MNWLSLFAFFIEEALVNLRRHGLVAVATVTTVALSVGLWGLFALARRGAERWLLWESEKLERLCVFLKPATDEATAKKVMKKVRKLPQVASVRFVHKNEGLQKLQKLFGNSMPLQDLVGHNPLPHALEVTCHSPQSVTGCAERLQRFPEVDEVSFPAAAVERFVRFWRGMQWVATALSLLLAVVAFTLIYNAVRLSGYSRRDEIRIMQLVGATVWTVRGPLIMEGLIYGLLGSILTLALLGALRQLGMSVLEIGYLRSLIEATQIDNAWVGQIIALGTGLGVLSALVAAVRLVKAV